ncbi:RNA 2',3'-cyclic phosphodiesterase [Sphingomonas sp. Leaf38]|uniref:RNA 2',3'-cyclic phosphodiesterase n=1 Tax=Sphingomonas sp. Leaf38 TaxID=1736217 RepID=UPI0006F34DFC|nr:RNA 2',3'-cyclic phosphodiesterase [Sphingomonas sp. Leaf38]KQN29669.1 2'-5' RNA ligase [Sphingomonas sp. Leaf38]
MIRLFVALRPPPPIRRSLLDIMEGVPAARWQDDDQLHITLRFIGAVERPVAEDIAVALSHVVAPAPVVSLAGVGQFEKRGRTDTLWVGFTPHDALAALHRKVDQACVRAGLEPERRAYLPHMTVARLPRSAAVGIAVDPWLATHAGLASASFPLPHLVLYQSHLGRDGATYAPVARWALDTPPGTRAAAGGSPEE